MSSKLVLTGELELVTFSMAVSTWEVILLNFTREVQEHQEHAWGILRIRTALKRLDSFYYIKT